MPFEIGISILYSDLLLHTLVELNGEQKKKKKLNQMIIEK